MDSYAHHIVISKGNTGHAYVSGTIDALSFYVIVHKEPFANALHYETNDLGVGHIERLLIYSEDTDFEGSPFTPSMTIKRNVYAEFHGGWFVYNPIYESYVIDLMRYFKQRSAFHTV